MYTAKCYIKACQSCCKSSTANFCCCIFFIFIPCHTLQHYQTMKLALFLSIVATFLFVTVAAVPEEWETTDVLPDLQNANTAQKLVSANDNLTKTRPKLVSDLSKIKPPNITRNGMMMNNEDVKSNPEHLSAGEPTGPSSERRKNPIHSDHEQAVLLNEVENHTNEHTNLNEIKIDDTEASHKEVSEEKGRKNRKYISTSNIAPGFRNVWTGIDPYYYTSQVHIGRPYKKFFSVNLNGSHIYGRFISSMKVYYDNYYIRGILFEYTDGMRTWSEMIGVSNGYRSTDTFYLQLGEKLTTLHIYGAYSSDRNFGGFYLRTDQGRSFAAHPPRSERRGTFRVPIGSGVLASAVGYYTQSRIRSLGFQMLNRVNRIEVSYVNYRYGLPSDVSLQPMQFHTMTYDNTDGRTRADQHYVLKDCKTMRRSHEWRSNYGRALEAHFGDIMQFHTYTLVLHPSSTTSTIGSVQYGPRARHLRRNESKTEQHCYEFPVTVPSGHYTTMSAVLYSGSYQIFYIANYDLYYDSNGFYRQVHNGTYYGVTPGKIVAKLK